MGMFLAGFIIGFIYGWKLTLVVLSVVPLMAAGGAIFAKILAQAAAGGQGFYAQAGAVADEVLRMIRTVIAFDTQEKVCDALKFFFGRTTVVALPVTNLG